jgi:alpha-galactosidase/6-phospho-beta-glucosidase family protein
MKLVLIGGGSFVFAPTVLEDAIVKHRLAGQLILVDPNEAAVEAMAGAGRRIARELGVEMEVIGVTDRRLALPGADYVIVSASPQGASRWKIDYDILTRHGMADQARECGGLGGMMNAFRSITLLLEVCKDMEALCPDAVLLDVTNPMPRVVTAIERYTSIRSAGFCNIAHRGPNGYEWLPRLLKRKPEDLHIVTAGLNHFAWVGAIRDKRTGEDLLFKLADFIAAGDWQGFDAETARELDIMRRWLHEYGAVAAGHVDHHAEYLPPQAGVRYTTSPPYHGTEEDRAKRLQELQRIAAGEGDWRDMFDHGSWEHPVDVALALHAGASANVAILNTRNGDAIAQLPEDRIVEVPVTIAAGRITTAQVPPFPDKLASLLRVLSDVHERVAEAAVKGDALLARAAIELDPSIVDKERAYAAFGEMLDAHADLLPQFAR